MVGCLSQAHALTAGAEGNTPLAMNCAPEYTYHGFCIIESILLVVRASYLSAWTAVHDCNWKSSKRGDGASLNKTNGLNKTNQVLL